MMGAFIANAIGDKPAIMPAFVCSYLANSTDLLGTQVGAGFLAPASSDSPSATS